MAKIATTIWLLAFGLWTSTLFDARAQPAAAPSLGASTSISSPGSGPVAAGPEVAPAPGTDCLTVLLGMADCLSYVQQGSNETKPDKACCPELKTIVDTQPQCLCELLAQNDTYGFQIDFNRASKLPSVCKVDTPPVSTCALLGIPVGGPTSSEGSIASPGLSPGELPSTGSSTAPFPSLSLGSYNGPKASTTAASVVVVLVGFAIRSFF